MVRMVFIAVLAFCLTTNLAFASYIKTSANRETVLDRKVHIEEKILDVPQVQPLCDAIKGLKREKIDIGGCKLYCEQEGKGTPIVLISGGPGCTHHLFHPYFSRAVKYARVIYYDQRGVGQSDMDSSAQSYTVKQAVEDLENLRKALKINKWVVVGHSYGGFLAQCYALEHPESLIGLVMVCAAPGTPRVPLDDTRQQDYMTNEEVAKVNSIYTNGKLTEEQQLYNAHLNGDWKRQDFYRPTSNELARMARYEWKPGSGFRDRIGSQIYRIDLEGKFANFDIPTLIAEAKWDLTWNTDKPGKMLKNHPGAKMVVFERSGHSPFHDEPDRFFSVLDDFIKSAKAAPVPAADRRGKGVDWPLPVVDKIESLPWTNAGKQAFDVFTEAKAANLTDNEAWLKLGLVLYDGKYYPESLEVFHRVALSKKSDDICRFMAITWQGMILDILGKREEALTYYKQAMGIDIGGGGIQHDQYGIVLNRQWVEERLETPFERK